MNNTQETVCDPAQLGLVEARKRRALLLRDIYKLNKGYVTAVDNIRSPLWRAYEKVVRGRELAHARGFVEAWEALQDRVVWDD